ncbi:MAG: transglycosylase SLT domain-containing protein [Methylophilaceae bacterium]
MKIFSIHRLILVIMTLTFSCMGHANTGDEIVLKAKQAYEKEDVIALSSYATQLQTQKHLLAPYAKYWLMRLDIENIDNQRITNFLAQYNDYAFADRLRGEYLKKLGLHQDWDTFSYEYAKYQSENAAVSCYAEEAYHSRPNTGALTSAKHLWLTSRSRPNDCGRLFDLMQAGGIIDEDAVWQRFRLATSKNRISLARSIIKRSKRYQSSHGKQLKKAAAKPKTVIDKGQISFNSRFGREVNLYALTRLAKKDTWQAVAAFKKVQNKFNVDERSYFYSMLGLSAAKRHEPEASIWFQKADFETLNDEQVSWYARATLRQRNWGSLLGIIEKMPPAVADEARWRYWRARALIARQRGDEALGILTNLAPERHYYGWLAQDEIKNYNPVPLLHYKPTREEISSIAELAAVQRAEALFNMDLRWEGKREWAKAIEGFDDKRLLAAAQFANRKQWYDIAVNTADGTKEWHDFSLRYLTPHKRLMKAAASQHGVDLTWVYGITRQESRFMHYAKSHAGAAGLMQLMPTTARWAAKRAGVSNYKRSMIHDLDTNITIGTYYLSYTLAVMNGNKIMATAGYNAGPSRAKRWRAKEPLEGAIYAETIPFNETRVYVQRVIANAHMYAKQLGDNRKTLKQRMGTVPAKS